MPVRSSAPRDENDQRDPLNVSLSAICGLKSDGVQVRKVPILLQKSFWDDERKFSKALARIARGDVRDHIASQSATALCSVGVA